jgi:histidinol-phosphate aminotransferase
MSSVKHVRPSRPELEYRVPYDAKDIKAEVMLAANEHPSNLPGEIVEKISGRLREFRFNRYPDPMATRLRELIAEANGLEPHNVLIGNGGDELIFDLLLAWGGPGRTLLDCPPTFAMYGIDAQVTGTELVRVPRGADFEVDADAVLARLAGGDIDVVMIAQPNNPTGNLTPETVLIDILNATDALVLVDEAYFEFSRHTMRPHMERHPNLVILRTFSKAFSLAGLRVGYVLGHEDVIRELTKVRQPYSVDSFAQWVAASVFRERVVFQQAIRDIMRGRDTLMHGLSAIEGIEVFPSEANFVLFRVPHAAALWRDLLHSHSVLVRDFSRSPGLEDCLRVTVGSDEENERFLAAVDDITSQRRASEILGAAEAHVRHGTAGELGY